ncbi:MAG: hypothetical protein E7Z91_03585 [Cyanobacteria bacterium SIG30]|nr:hypothetical protein [Cyanobacteria bacterium SIG30]
MIGSINNFNQIVRTNSASKNHSVGMIKPVSNPIVSNNFSTTSNVSFQANYQANIRTTLLAGDEIQMYNNLINVLSKDISPVATGDISSQQKLAELLRNGKLLNNSSNDNTTTLKNLHDMLTQPRVKGFDSVKLVKQAIDTLYKPSIITQTFGDIPNEVKSLILNNPEVSQDIKNNPELLDVKNNGSGTCPAASLEFHLANKRPAEFARWANELTSPKMSVTQKLKMSSLSKNYMDAVWFLNAFETRPSYLDFQNAVLELKPDKNAYTRAHIQNGYYDKGERNVLDVLIQSTLMQNASQQSYDSLSDIRAGKFNSNPQGLSSDEKTFIESIVTNEEKLSIVYQNIDDNQYLTSYKCDFAKIENHIKQAIDIGEDVIIGYVFTDNSNKVTGGHEITIVDYKQDKNGETIFVCNDTDDNNDELIEYKASYLLPKIHHAGYPAHLVEHETALLNA